MTCFMGKPLKDFRKYYLEIILSMCLFLKLQPTSFHLFISILIPLPKVSLIVIFKRGIQMRSEKKRMWGKPTQSCQIISICNKLRNSEEIIQQVFKLSTTKEEATKHANFGEEDPFYHSLHLVIKKNLRKERPLFHCFFRILHFIEKSEIHTKFNQGESRR